MVKRLEVHDLIRCSKAYVLLHVAMVRTQFLVILKPKRQGEYVNIELHVPVCFSRSAQAP